jgi:hypothetical protein
MEARLKPPDGFAGAPAGLTGLILRASPSFAPPPEPLLEPVIVPALEFLEFFPYPELPFPLAFSSAYKLTS